jgi:rubrerythrin
MILEQAKQVFKAFDPENFTVTDGQIPAYEEALAVEKKSIDFYSEQLSSLEFEAERKPFLRLSPKKSVTMQSWKDAQTRHPPPIAGLKCRFRSTEGIKARRDS